MPQPALISEEYRTLNKELHHNKVAYGMSGQHWAKHIQGFCQAIGTKDLLDYGCGKGTLADHLPFPIKQYDPAIEKHSAMPDNADIVVCTDVMEHIEPENLDNVLQHIASLMRKAGFFVISTTEAAKTLPDGRNAHLIVQPGEWWFNKLSEFFTVTQYNKIKPNEVVIVMVPKGKEMQIQGTPA